MPITRTSQIDDDGTGMTGTVWNNAWKTELYNQIDAALGALVATGVNIPFVAGNFRTDSGVWTVTQAINRYVMIGTSLAFWEFTAQPSSIAANSTALIVDNLPFTFAPVTVNVTAYPVSFSAPSPCRMFGAAAHTAAFYRNDGAVWPTGAISIYVAAVLEVA